MHQTKRKKLAAAGWKVGSTAQFLELTAEQTAYIEMRLKLAEGLKRRRVQSRLTQVEAAKLLQSSQSRVAKMEAGDPSVSLDLLVKSHLALGSSPSDVAEIIRSESTVGAA
jgi:predicted XRE-type DNA-binding protein